MIIQIDNFIKAGQLRKEVLRDCVAQLKKINLRQNTILIANVPYFTEDNYNNEEVFWLTWAFDGGLRIFGLNQEIRSVPVCWRTVADKDYNPAHNINNGGYANIPEDTDLLYYEFDHKTHKSKLEKLAGKDGLEKKLAQIKNDRINYYPLILREKIRGALRSLAVKKTLL